MKKRKDFFLRTAAAAAALCFMLSGCSAGTGLAGSGLMHPPRPTGERGRIYSLLESKAGKSFTLKYPCTGESRSAVIQHKMNSSGQQLAFAFYQSGSTDSSVNVFFTVKNGSNWQDAGTFTNTGAQVDRVCFGDLDGDGTDEVIIGWGNSAGSPGTACVYHLQNGKMSELKIEQTYSELAVGDFMGRGKKQLFLASVPPDGTQQFTAALLAYKDSAIKLMGSIRLDTGINKFSGITVGEISKGQPGVLLDCTLGSGKMLTELVFWNKNKNALLAPLYNQTAPLQNITLRETELLCRDSNGSGTLEFPIVTRLPAYSGSASDDVGSETQWTQFDAATGNFKAILKTVVNSADSYTFELPAKWINHITTKYDSTKHILTFYALDISNGTVGKPLLSVQAFSKKDWEAGKKTAGMTQMFADTNTVLAAVCPTPSDKLAYKPAELQHCIRRSALPLGKS